MAWLKQTGWVNCARHVHKRSIWMKCPHCDFEGKVSQSALVTEAITGELPWWKDLQRQHEDEEKRKVDLPPAGG